VIAVPTAWETVLALRGISQTTSTLLGANTVEIMSQTLGSSAMGDPIAWEPASANRTTFQTQLPMAANCVEMGGLTELRTVTLGNIAITPPASAF
jgi:hypothetical protein